MNSYYQETTFYNSSVKYTIVSKPNSLIKARRLHPQTGCNQKQCQQSKRAETLGQIPPPQNPLKGNPIHVMHVVQTDKKDETLHADKIIN